MNIEIERKFLVISENFKQHIHEKLYIRQGFLNSNKNRVVRVRILDTKGYLTIKGMSNSTGMIRFEWEKEIELSEAKQLMNLCEPGVIEKYRYLVKVGGHLFEIDEFLNENIGLVIAEIELNNENEKFHMPEWLGKEVTGIKRYYNSELSKNPYNNWDK